MPRGSGARGTRITTYHLTSTDTGAWTVPRTYNSYHTTTVCVRGRARAPTRRALTPLTSAAPHLPRCALLATIARHRTHLVSISGLYLRTPLPLLPLLPAPHAHAALATRVPTLPLLPVTHCSSRAYVYHTGFTCRHWLCPRAAVLSHTLPYIFSFANTASGRY